MISHNTEHKHLMINVILSILLKVRLYYVSYYEICIFGRKVRFYIFSILQLTWLTIDLRYIYKKLLRNPSHPDCVYIRILYSVW